MQVFTFTRLRIAERRRLRRLLDWIRVLVGQGERVDAAAV